ncbi:MAG TPA: enoyl-CoA hydratase/isomerase family protein [Acidimicrobiales bacterium]|nr:enoyl-CoA hydratase/isomerase family protein [Acidimicrobiales bacterium]
MTAVSHDGGRPSPDSSEVVGYALEGEIALVTLNRPERLNAVNHDLVRGLCRALDRAGADGAAAVVLTGAGRAFCAGHDLKQPPETVPDEHSLRRLQDIQDVTRKIRALAAPVIAAVHGYALGAGCEFALCCDLVVAERGTVFGFPEVEVGLGVTGGISHLLPLAVGAVRAKELVLLGRRFDADEAARLGLANAVVGDAREEAMAWARELAGKPRLAAALAKQCLDQGPEGDLEAALELEVAASLGLMATTEAAEAADRFAARGRTPETS